MRQAFRHLGLGILILFMAFIVQADEVVPTWTPPTPTEVIRRISGLSFDAFIDEAHRLRLLQFPLGISAWGLSDLVGVRNDRLIGPLDPAQAEETGDIILDSLRDFDRSTLSFDQRIEAAVVDEIFSEGVGTPPFWSSLLPVGNNSISDLDRILQSRHPVRTFEDLEDYVTRLWQIDDLVDQWLREIDEDVVAGILPSQNTLMRLAFQLEDRVHPYRVLAHPYYEYGVDKLAEWKDRDSISREARDGFLASLREVIETCAIPSFARLQQRIEQLMLEASPEHNWILHPDWQTYYRSDLRKKLGTDLSVEVIHSLALQDLARIESEIRSYSKRIDSSQIEMKHLNQELWWQQYHCTRQVTSNALLERAEILYDLAFDRAGSLFHQLPTEPPVFEIESASNPTYWPEPFDASRPPRFVISKDEMFEWNELPNLLYHEALPGHHLQHHVARSTSVPVLQQLNGWIGYTEGWATYAQYLTAEQGWYRNDTCGHLDYLRSEFFMLMTVILETGRLGLGWSDAQTVDFLRPRMPGDPWELLPFLNEFIYEPVRVTPYFIGRYLLVQLRDRAQRALGADFRLADYHRAVLEQGNVPLKLLEPMVDHYIREKASRLLASP